MRAVPLCVHRARHGPACRWWWVCGKRSIGNTTRGGSALQIRRQIAVICGEEERSCDKWGNWDIWAKWVRLCETCLATHRFLANEPHALAADEERRHEHVHRSAAIEHRGAPQGTFWRSEPLEPARANANGSSGGSVRNGGWAEWEGVPARMHAADVQSRGAAGARERQAHILEVDAVHCAHGV